MPIYRLKNNGNWKKLAKVYRLKNTGNWKSLSAIYRLKNTGVWKKVFGSVSLPEIDEEVEITLSDANATTGLRTLTGTNYHWTNATSLQYRFQWYNSTTWQTINSGTITNPVSGSSNTKTYIVQIADTNPNTDNLYRFVVIATNSSGSSDSTSGTVTISTPRNVTNVTASQVGTNLEASVSFTPGLYTNSVIIRRYKYSGGILQSTDDFNKTSSSPTTVVLDEYNRQYRFSVIPYTGNFVSSVTGYPGNESALSAQFTANFPPTPIPITKPTLTNTGSRVIGTTLTANQGSYQLNTIAEGDPNIAIRTRVYGWQFPGPTLTNGTSTPPSPNVTSGSSQSLTTTQTMVNYVFYAVDIVTSADAQTDYYFYSDLSSTAFMPSFSDDFNRPATTGSQGIGVTSTGSWVWANDMVGTYGWMMPVVDTDNVSWQIDYDEVSGRRTAYTAKNPTFANDVSHYPLKSINVGDGNVSLKVSIPDGGGGPGLAFWVTGSGSWWAVAPSYYSSTTSVTTYPCTDGPYEHTSTTCPTVYPGSTTVGQVCSCTAGSTTTGTACNDGPYSHTSTTCPTVYPGSTTIGQVCSCTAGSTTIDCNGSITHYTSSALASAECGSCAVTQNTNHYQTCPTPTNTSPKYSDNTLGTGCNQKCSCLGPFTETDPGTSTCAPNGIFETDDPGVTITCVTAADDGKACGKTQVPGGWSVRRCTVVTPSSSSTFYRCTTRECSDSWSCTYRNVTTNASYYLVGSTTTTTNASLYKVKQVVSDVTTYYSRIRILSASGSAVTSSYLLGSNNSTTAGEVITSSTSAYQLIKGLEVSTTGNTITAKAYSDENLVTQIGNTKSYNATSNNPTKTIAGDSSVGIINTPTDANRLTGNRLDNFVYTNV